MDNCACWCAPFLPARPAVTCPFVKSFSCSTFQGFSGSNYRISVKPNFKCPLLSIETRYLCRIIVHNQLLGLSQASSMYYHIEHHRQEEAYSIESAPGLPNALDHYPFSSSAAGEWSLYQRKWVHRVPNLKAFLRLP